MSYIVRKYEDKIEVVYGSQQDRVLVSKRLVKLIRESQITLDQSADDYKDVLVSRVKRRIEDDQKLDARSKSRLLFEPAVYGRAVEKMHPINLTHVTMVLGPDEQKVLRSISCEVGREKRKLAAVR